MQSPTGETESKGQESSMIRKEDDSGRVDQIMRVDTGALIKIIQELESKLSEHHRHDKLPPWAETLISRIELLEKAPLSTPRVVKSDLGGAAPPTPLSLNEFASDERLIVKMKAALDSQLSTTKLALDSKMNSVSFEIERLHKLLNIRPTTSEFQQVVLSMNEVQRKMFDSLSDISTGMFIYLYVCLYLCIKCI
jgi:hypothetical protein